MRHRIFIVKLKHHQKKRKKIRCSYLQIYVLNLSWPLAMIHSILSHVCLFSFTLLSHVFFLLSHVFSLLSHFLLFASDLSRRGCVGTRCMHEGRRWKRLIYIRSFLYVLVCVFAFFLFGFVSDMRIKILSSQT